MSWPSVGALFLGAVGVLGIGDVAVILGGWLGRGLWLLLGSRVLGLWRLSLWRLSLWRLRLRLRCLGGARLLDGVLGLSHGRLGLLCRLRLRLGGGPPALSGGPPGRP